MTPSLNSSPNIVVVGAGKMGGAIIEGWLKQGVEPSSIYVVDRNEETLSLFAKKGLKAFKEVGDLPSAHRLVCSC